MKKSVVCIYAISLFACNSQKNIKSDFEIRKNETFDITLISNPSTSYSWKWINDRSSKLVDSVSKNYTPTKVKEGIVGSGGNEIWKFKGKEKGIDTLTFEYCRSWEPNSTVETKKISVKIK